MKSAFFSLLTGILFGLGLIISEMVNPKRVRGFLDISGYWDPTLLFVMLGALCVTTLGYRIVLSRGKPFFAMSFFVPKHRVVDRRLILGAILFGVGWGLSGLCPGPAIVGLSTFNIDILLFVIAMIVGMKTFQYIDKK